MNWHEYFINLAETVAIKSKDDSTQVGCIIVGPDHEVRGTGYNGFPRGVAYNAERRKRPAKYYWTAHAEQNAVFHAARVGVPCKGCTLYLNYEPFVCCECAKALSGAGISRIIGPYISFPGKGKHWEEHREISQVILRSANISCYMYHAKSGRLREVT